MSEIYKKLFEIQKETGAIKKTKTNPFTNSQYFDINQLLEVLIPKFQEHGLLLLQPLTHVGDKPAIKTLIVDTKNGETLESIVPLPPHTDAQKMGGAVTYTRRYSIQSLLALQAEDDDGNDASGISAQTKETEANGNVAKYDTWEDGLGMEPSEPTTSKKCKECRTTLVHETRGKYSGFFCPKAPKGDRTHTVIWDKK